MSLAILELATDLASLYPTEIYLSCLPRAGIKGIKVPQCPTTFFLMQKQEEFIVPTCWSRPAYGKREQPCSEPLYSSQGSSH